MPHISYTHTASHLRPGLNIGERKVAVAQAFNVLNSSGLRIDMLVATGISGIVFGTSLADMMNLPLAIVRKETDRSCSDKRVEGPDRTYGGDPIHWVFVDDLISSGTTYRRVLHAMIATYGDSQLLAGVMLYKPWDESSYGIRSLEPKLTVPVFTLFARQWN